MLSCGRCKIFVQVRSRTKAWGIEQQTVEWFEAEKTESLVSPSLLIVCQGSSLQHSWHSAEKYDVKDYPYIL